MRLGGPGGWPLGLPPPVLLFACRAWQGKRGKEPPSQAQGLAAKLLVGREARAAPWHLAGGPASPFRKYLQQRSPPARTGRLSLLLQLLAEESDLQARLGQVLTWPQEAARGPQGPAWNTSLAVPELGGGVRPRGFQADFHPWAWLGSPNFPFGPPSPMASRAGGSCRVLGLESPCQEARLEVMACQVQSGWMWVSAEPGTQKGIGALSTAGIWGCGSGLEAWENEK